MGMMIVRHKVRDYGQWRPIFDRHADMQKRAGLINPRVYHSADSNKSEIVVVLIPRIRRRLRTSWHPLTSKKRWRRLEFWTLRQSISLNRSIKHASSDLHGVATRRFKRGSCPWRKFSSLAPVVAAVRAGHNVRADSTGFWAATSCGVNWPKFANRRLLPRQARTAPTKKFLVRPSQTKFCWRQQNPSYIEPI